jgi:hypothetical protein
MSQSWGFNLELVLGALRMLTPRRTYPHSNWTLPLLLLKILPSAEVKPHHNITVSWDGGAEPTEENLRKFCMYCISIDLYLEHELYYYVYTLT